MWEKSFLEACSDNPFVVGFHGLVREPGSMELRLVMEYVGHSLRDFLRNDDPPVPEATVRAIMWQLLTGADKMHRLHIMHRDIKPENILVSDHRNIAKICDFGLALHMSSDAPPSDEAGTTRYMAPEVLLGKTDYDTLVETWALGCVMAELVGGRVLFRGSDEGQGQLRAIIGVLGLPDDKAWPWLHSTPSATLRLRHIRYARRRSQLRKWFPDTMLSEQVFQVLRGLLTWNPDKRLTASAALNHPWFADLNAAPAPEPKKEKLTSALPEMIVPPTNLQKRRKLQCA